MTARRASAAFTLIELIVVMAIIATLLSLAVPRYYRSVERSKEAVLRQDLSVMRDALDKFYSDAGRYPDTLDELVAKRYLRKIPPDPITERSDSWQVLAPPNDQVKGRVYDIRSGAEGASTDGTPFAEW